MNEITAVIEAAKLGALIGAVIPLTLLLISETLSFRRRLKDGVTGVDKLRTYVVWMRYCVRKRWKWYLIVRGTAIAALFGSTLAMIVAIFGIGLWYVVT